MKPIPLTGLQWNSLQQHEFLLIIIFYYRPSQTEIGTLLVHSINPGSHNSEWRRIHVVAVPVTYQKMDAAFFFVFVFFWLSFLVNSS